MGEKNIKKLNRGSKNESLWKRRTNKKLTKLDKESENKYYTRQRIKWLRLFYPTPIERTTKQGLVEL